MRGYTYRDTNVHQGHICCTPFHGFPDFFRGIGTFLWDYHITLCDDATPMIHAPGKCPIVMRILVKQQQVWLQDLWIIMPVTGPTGMGLQSGIQLEVKWNATCQLGFKGSQPCNQVEPPSDTNSRWKHTQLSWQHPLLKSWCHFCILLHQVRSCLFTPYDFKFTIWLI